MEGIESTTVRSHPCLQASPLGDGWTNEQSRVATAVGPSFHSPDCSGILRAGSEGGSGGIVMFMNKPEEGYCLTGAEIQRKAGPDPGRGENTGCQKAGQTPMLQDFSGWIWGKPEKK